MRSPDAGAFRDITVEIERCQLFPSRRGGRLLG